MRGLFYLLLSLLGFAATSCLPVDMYGCPPAEYDEQRESSHNSTERVEPNSVDEFVADEG